MFSILAFAVVWLLGLLLTVKLDAALCPQPSDYWDKVMLAIVLWPVLALFLLATKHKSSNVTGKFTY